jgi:YidC/Oxa1 family membrane protein insertase
MQSNRTPFAIFIIILVILFYTEIFLKPAAPISAPSSSMPASSSNGTTSNTPITPTATTPNTTTTQPILSNQDFANSPITRIESKLLKLDFRSLGGRLTAYELKKFKRKLHDKDKLNLVTINNNLAPLAVSNSGISDETTLYTLESASNDTKRSGKILRVTENGSSAFRFVGTLANGTKIIKTLEVNDNTYTIGVTVALEGATTDSKVNLSWTEKVDESKSSQYNVKQVTTFNQLERELERYPLHDIAEAPITTPDTWIGFGDNYFINILISTDPKAEASFNLEQDHLKYSITSTEPQASFKIYAGPKDKDFLTAAGYSLERSMDLGWFAIVGQPLLSALKILNGFLGNYGLAIVLLTLILKLLLLPLTQSSFKSMKGLQTIQPQVAALRERLKDDPTQMNTQMMELYKKNGVNPLGGCIPALLQIPIFLGMYNALQNSIYLRHAPFALWVKDLAAPEELMILGIPVPFMILLMGGSMFVQMFTTPSTGDPTQRKVMLFMPVVFTISFLFLPIPSGLVLYWLVSNLISIVQQLALHKFKRVTPLQATIMGSIAIMLGAYILTLI